MLARDSELSFRRSLLSPAAAATEARQGDERKGDDLQAVAMPPARLVYAHVAGANAQQHRESLGDGQSQLHQHGRVPPPPPQQHVGGAEACMPVEAEHVVFEHRLQNAEVSFLSICDASLVYEVSAFPICRVPLAPFDAQRLTPRHARLHALSNAHHRRR